jgi:hypothetical protein
MKHTDLNGINIYGFNMSPPCQVYSKTVQHFWMWNVACRADIIAYAATW